MKKYSIKFLSVLLTLMIFITSCDSWIDPEINDDPNNPTDVPMALLVGPIQVSWAYQLGGDLVMASRCWTQQFAGVDRQLLAFDRYQITQGDVDNLWRFNTYAASLMDTKILIDKAIEQESPHYQGLAQVLWAIQFLTMSDYWGDIPYSQSCLGTEYPNPAFDTQLSIFQDLETVLDNAIVNLQATESTLSPGGDDLIYGGDLTLWVKAAYAVKARLLLHWGNSDASKLTGIAECLNNTFADETENMVVAFDAADANPMYQFLEQREGYAMAGEYWVNELNGGTPADMTDDDPRLTQFVAPNLVGEYIGNPMATPGVDASEPGPFFDARDAIVPFITYEEMKFIEAELNVGTAAADAAYQEGVLASLRTVGVAGVDAAWEAANITGMTGVTLEQIIDAKYLALSMQSEVFSDYRRTGFPALATFGGAAMPVRYPYATASFVYNGASMDAAGVSDIDENDPVWWDQ